MKIYFAGPNVFHPRAKEMESLIVSYCKTVGVDPLIPGDSGIDWSNPDKQEIGREIFAINRDHLINCDGVIANTTPFRGACIDDGTAWEIGFAHALGKPIITYASGDLTTGETIRAYSGLASEGSPARDRNGFLIEEFGFQSNCMIACAVADHVHCDFDCYNDIVRAISKPINLLLKKFGNR